MKFKDYAKAFNATMLSAATMHAENSAKHEANSENDDSAKRAAQREATHARYASILSTIDENVLKLAHEFNIDAQKLEQSSRENKKRTLAALRAIAAQRTLRKSDNALDAALSYMTAKQTRDLSLRIITREVQHETHTQARYMKTFFETLDAIESVTKDSDSKDVRFTLKNDSAIVNALLSLYSVSVSA